MSILPQSEQYFDCSTPPIHFPFEDEGPTEADATWWAAQHQADALDDDYGDFVAWLDHWAHLEWSYYPGVGNWSETSPCHAGQGSEVGR